MYRYQSKAILILKLFLLNPGVKIKRYDIMLFTNSVSIEAVNQQLKRFRTDGMPIKVECIHGERYVTYISDR